MTSRQAQGVWTFVGTVEFAGEGARRTMTVKYATGQTVVLKSVR